MINISTHHFSFSLANAHTAAPSSKKGKGNVSEPASPMLEDPVRWLQASFSVTLTVWERLGNVVSCWVLPRPGKRDNYSAWQLVTFASGSQKAHKFSMEGATSKRPAVSKVKGGESPRSGIPTGWNDVIWRRPRCPGRLSEIHRQRGIRNGEWEQSPGLAIPRWLAAVGKEIPQRDSACCESGVVPLLSTCLFWETG